MRMGFDAIRVNRCHSIIDERLSIREEMERLIAKWGACSSSDESASWSGLLQMPMTSILDNNTQNSSAYFFATIFSPRVASAWKSVDSRTMSEVRT